MVTFRRLPGEHSTAASASLSVSSPPRLPSQSQTTRSLHSYPVGRGARKAPHCMCGGDCADWPSPGRGPKVSPHVDIMRPDRQCLPGLSKLADCAGPHASLVRVCTPAVCQAQAAWGLRTDQSAPSSGRELLGRSPDGGWSPAVSPEGRVGPRPPPRLAQPESGPPQGACTLMEQRLLLPVGLLSPHPEKSPVVRADVNLKWLKQ